MIVQILIKKKLSFIAFFGVLLFSFCQGCTAGRIPPTRTPLPTWTSTPVTASSDSSSNNAQSQGENTNLAQAVSSAPQETAVPADIFATDTPQPTATPLPTNTSTPTPSFTPTSVPQPTATPLPTNTPVPTPTPNFGFELESVERFPTESLAQNVVRIFVYVYSPFEFALADYTISVARNGTPLDVDALSSSGLPSQTRQEPSAYTRFTNLDVIFVETQAGEWVVQLLDSTGQAVGPEAKFEVTDDEETRELYVRYRQR